MATTKCKDVVNTPREIEYELHVEPRGTGGVNIRVSTKKNPLGQTVAVLDHDGIYLVPYRLSDNPFRCENPDSTGYSQLFVNEDSRK